MAHPFSALVVRTLRTIAQEHVASPEPQRSRRPAHLLKADAALLNAMADYVEAYDSGPVGRMRELYEFVGMVTERGADRLAEVVKAYHTEHT